MANHPRFMTAAPRGLLIALLAAAAPYAAHAQTVEGRAVDRATQQPVAGAEITLVDARGDAAATAHSGADGGFRLTGPAAGEYRVTARRLGYQTMLSTVLQVAEGQVLQVEARLTPRETEMAVSPTPTRDGITGRVAEAGTGRAVAGATVTLLNERGHNVGRAVADAEGNFHLDVQAPGRLRLRADRVGYQRTLSEPITVVPNDRVRVELLVSTEAVVLAPLTVVASSRSVTRNSHIAGFQWRQEHHPWGRFMGPEQIARIQPFYVTDVLQQVPFVQIQGGGLDRYPTLRGRVGARCSPTIYVDGHPSMAGQGLTIDQLVSGPDVEAVEVYDRAFEAPAEFLSGTNYNCGVIVIWTRPPGQNGG